MDQSTRLQCSFDCLLCMHVENTCGGIEQCQYCNYTHALMETGDYHIAYSPMCVFAADRGWCTLFNVTIVPFFEAATFEHSNDQPLQSAQYFDVFSYNCVMADGFRVFSSVKFSAL